MQTDAAPRPKALFILSEGNWRSIYGPELTARAARLVDLYAARQDADVLQRAPDLLRDLEVVLTGWGGPRYTAEFLAAAPRLKAVFYGAGSVRHYLTDAFWQRDIAMTSSYAANAVPVGEYLEAQIVLCLKRAWQQALRMRHTAEWGRIADPPGAYGTTVGLVSLGMVGRQVLERMKRHDVRLLAYEVAFTPDEVRRMGAEPCSLGDVFARADVVSVHTALLPETRGMVGREHFVSMKPGATFINASRGAIVRQDELIEVLRERPDLFAVLDVTDPEPPEPGSALLSMENVIVTPHIAGSLGAECRRMGQYALDELERWLRGERLRWRVTREVFERMA